MLERRTIILPDGTTHSYFALPPDDQDFFPPTRARDHLGGFPPLGPDLVGPGRLLGPISPDGFRAGEDQFGRNRNHDYRNSPGLDGRTGGHPEGSMKRKYGEVERDIQDELARQRQHLRYTDVGGSLEERDSLLPGTSSPFRREDELRRSPGRLPGPMSPDGFWAGEDQFGRNRNHDYRNSHGLDERTGCPPERSMKRKYGEVEVDIQDELARQRQHLRHTDVGGSLEESNSLLPGTSSPLRREDELSRSSKVMRVGGGLDTVGDFHHYQSVDPASLKKAFLIFAKLLNENGNLKKNCLEDGRLGPVPCIACGRSSKDFPDVHGLIMHAYNSENADLRVDHLGLHKALCVLRGWNYMKPPDKSRAYQLLPADEAAANRDDLIMWPPMVMIHNTSTGKGKDGHVEGSVKREIERLIRGVGFLRPGVLRGKPKALYNIDGQLGIVLIKFAANQTGLLEAVQLEEYFEKKNHGRRGWVQVQSMLSGKDEENNPSLVKVNAKTGKKKRIYYGHLFTAFDLDKVDQDTKERAVLESKREYLQPK